MHLGQKELKGRKMKQKVNSFKVSRNTSVDKKRHNDKFVCHEFNKGN